MDLSATFGKMLHPGLAERLQQIFRTAPTGADAERMEFADGRLVPVVNNVPRFVSSDHYVKSFSFQWSHYTAALHDSQHNSTFSLRDFIDKFALTPEQVAGKLVLDAGCGTGRVSEILASWGAHVVGIDLSEAVDLARHYLAGFDNAVVLQADIGELPFRPEGFDFVISTGVLHHTPDTRAYAAKLVQLVRPGGEFAIWVYSRRFARRKEWIPLTSRLPHPAFNEWCRWVADVARRERGNPLLEIFMKQFPFATHHETAERSALTLFDGYTPTYHGVHSPEEVMGWFREFGLVDVRSNAVETSMRGRKPA